MPNPSTSILYNGRQLSAAVRPAGPNDHGDAVIVNERRRLWHRKTVLTPFDDLRNQGILYRSNTVAGLRFEENPLELVVQFEGYSAGEAAIVGYPYRL